MREPEHRGNIRSFRRYDYLARGGERQDRIHRIEEGWAYRYRLLNDGRRQIIALFLPGDYCEPQWILSPEAINPIVALTPIRTSSIPLRDFGGAPKSTGVDTRQMLEAVLHAHDRQSEWIVNLGRKTAVERVCALLLEIFERNRASGRIVDSGCAMPLTQQDLADTIGLTPVHVNRVLKSLRAEGILEIKRHWLKITDANALQSIADVDHARRRPAASATIRQPETLRVVGL